MTRPCEETANPDPQPKTPAIHATETTVEYVKTSEMRTDDDQDTCLRPLGLCELGGSCESCWYRPDHPRFKKKGSSRK
ncbi:MAG: hypothetical protein V2I67_15790 [Thermoanaerobaculales bacterium]|jgi:hypothetical protein|nr:hypothetical protein [Thermoanaerobaculales bacterium]